MERTKQELIDSYKYVIEDIRKKARELVKMLKKKLVELENDENFGNPENDNPKN